MIIRLPAFAGQFYPDDPEELSKMIDQFLNQVKDNSLDKVDVDHLKGLIVPHAGYPYSAPIAAYGYKLLQALPQEKDYKIILIGLSHQALIDQAATDNNDAWHTRYDDLWNAKEINVNLTKYRYLISIME